MQRITITPETASMYLRDMASYPSRAFLTGEEYAQDVLETYEMTITRLIVGYLPILHAASAELQKRERVGMPLLHDLLVKLDVDVVSSRLPQQSHTWVCHISNSTLRHSL